MEIKEENGITRFYDYEIYKALNKSECGVPITDFLRYEAENFKYGKEAYFNMLKKEIVDFDSMDWDYNENLQLEFQYFIRDGLEEIRKVILELEKTPPPKLTKSLSESQQTFLYEKLTENSLFLPIDSDFASFCFVFGNSLKPNNFKPLQWMQNKQLLRELIAELKHPNIFITTNKYTLPNYFIDEKGKTILYLPTDKKINNNLSNSIDKIAKKMRQTK